MPDYSISSERLVMTPTGPDERAALLLALQAYGFSEVGAKMLCETGVPLRPGSAENLGWLCTTLSSTEATPPPLTRTLHQLGGSLLTVATTLNHTSRPA